MMDFIKEESSAETIRAILSMTDTEHIGLMGHSMGGAASVTVGRTRDDIDAVIDLDGTMLGEQFSYSNGEYDFYDEAYPVPLLSVNNEEHYFYQLQGNLWVSVHNQKVYRRHVYLPLILFSTAQFHFLDIFSKHNEWL